MALLLLACQLIWRYISIRPPIFHRFVGEINHSMLSIIWHSLLIFWAIAHVDHTMGFLCSYFTVLLHFTTFLLSFYWIRSLIFCLGIITLGYPPPPFVVILRIWTVWVTVYVFTKERYRPQRNSNPVPPGSESTTLPMSYPGAMYKPKGFFQFEIIINVSDSSFRFIWIHMLWVYDHYEYFIFFSGGIVCRLRNLTSTDDPRAVRIRTLTEPVDMV